MRLWRFRRLQRDPETGAWSSPPAGTHWEIAFGEEGLRRKLAGDMAEVVAPAEPWWVRLWRLFRPRRPASTTATVDGKTWLQTD